VDYNGERLLIEVPFSDTETFVKQDITEVDVELLDGRTITRAQRGKIRATIAEIAAWNGDDADTLHELMKASFIARTGRDWFSLRDCTMTDANAYLDWLIEFVVINGIPTDNPVLRCADIGKYLYACLANKKCAVCGKKGVVHHIDTVGMGRNRLTIAHIGLRAECLCFDHHTEAHYGQADFDAKYHIYGIPVDENLCKIHNMGV